MSYASQYVIKINNTRNKGCRRQYWTRARGHCLTTSQVTLTRIILPIPYRTFHPDTVKNIQPAQNSQSSTLTRSLDWKPFDVVRCRQAGGIIYIALVVFEYFWNSRYIFSIRQNYMWTFFSSNCCVKYMMGIILNADYNAQQLWNTAAIYPITASLA